MAQFFTNFDEYPVGDITTSGQTDWSIKIANGTSDFRIIDGSDADGKFLRVQASGTNGSRVLSYNPLNGVSDNIETLVKFWIFKSGSDGSTGRYGASYIRYGGTTEAGTIGYAISFVPVSSVKSIVMYEDSTGVVQFQNFAWSMSTDYFIRTRLSGSSRQVKIWAASSAEPGSWTFSSSATPPTIASPYSGVGTYQADSYLYVKQFSAGTGGDTAPMYAITDKSQNGQFRVSVPPPSSAPADGYSGGYGGIAGYGQGYATAYYPTATTQEKDQTGQFRVRVTLDKPQVGQFRVRKTFDQAQIGKFRIRTTSDKAQLGQFRVKKVFDKTQVGAFRVKKTFDNTQVGRFWVRTLNTKNQVGQFRIASEPLRLQIGKFRVKVTNDKPQLGRFIIAAPADKPQIGKFRVRKTNDVTQIGKFRVRTTSLKTQTGIFRVRVTNVKDITGQFRLSVKSDKVQIGKFRVLNAYDKPQVGKFSVRLQQDRIQVGRFRVRTTSTVPQVGRFLVRKTNDKPQTGSFRVEYIGLKHQVGKFRIYDENTIPEVFIPNDRYVNSNGTYGSIDSATPDSGNLNQSPSPDTGEITVGEIDSGLFNQGTDSFGIIRSNNDYVILMFEDNFIWLSENGKEIIVEEFTKDDIINMISTEGRFTAGRIENGDIQEAL